jgi:hypothetical protein
VIKYIPEIFYITGDDTMFELLAAVPATGDTFPVKGLIIAVGAAIAIAVGCLIFTNKSDKDDK